MKRARQQLRRSSAASATNSHPAGGHRHDAMTALGNVARGRLLAAPGEATSRRGGAVGPSMGSLGHQPDPYVRAVLQNALGVDLGDVRVRSGGQSRSVVEALDADAVAMRGEIHVRGGYDHPATMGGRALLLHELVHVLQDTGKLAAPPGAAQSGLAQAQERQAKVASAALVDRGPLSPPLSRGDDDAGCPFG